tara:strand:+ start:16 stop:564 length:549 start_codon:yes stop_codon:yes gene_type:complete
MATKTKTKTKDKLSKALKNKFIDEMKDKKETERLERVKENANLKEVIIYTKIGCPFCTQLKDALIKEGVKYIEKTNTDYPLEWQKVSGITGIAIFPTIEVEENYLVPRRDFQQVPQGVSMTIGLANPKLTKPSNEIRIIEGLKTLSYHMSTAFSQLDNKINPLSSFITNIEKQIKEEEEKGE